MSDDEDDYVRRPSRLARLLEYLDKLHRPSWKQQSIKPVRFACAREAVTEWTWERAKMLAVFFTFKVPATVLRLLLHALSFPTRQPSR